MKTVIEMARESGLLAGYEGEPKFLEDFAELVRADERKQIALDKKAENARELGLDYEPSQQEPWPEEPAGHKAGGVQLSGTSKSKAITELYALFGAPHNADINLTGLNMLLDALITFPPAQRTWVGLTNNELQPIADEYRILFGGWVEEFARAIEAKLKEKNT